VFVILTPPSDDVIERPQPRDFLSVTLATGRAGFDRGFHPVDRLFTRMERTNPPAFGFDSLEMVG
jgi:hypothetical protein